MRFSQAKVEAWIASKPPGAREDIMALGKLTGDVLELTPAAYAQLQAKYAPNTPPPLPAALVMLRNAAKAVVRNGVQAVTGRGLFVSAGQEAERMLGCLGDPEKGEPVCPNFQLDQMRCALCGCNMERKWRLKAEHCPPPVNKW